MDRYGTCTITDAAMLAKRLSDNKNILFCYSSDQVTAHIVLITKLFEKIGTMSFGGNPEGSYCVSILYKGFYYFDLNGVDIHAGYLAEKLNAERTRLYLHSRNFKCDKFRINAKGELNC